MAVNLPPTFEGGTALPSAPRGDAPVNWRRQGKVDGPVRPDAQPFRTRRAQPAAETGVASALEKNRKIARLPRAATRGGAMSPLWCHPGVFVDRGAAAGFFASVVFVLIISA